MALTTPDGFPYDASGDQPLRSITGGSSGTAPVLAKVLQTKWTALVGTTIADIDARLLAAEAAVAASKWRHIDSGTESGAAFDIAVPAGYEILRLFLFGDLDGTGTVRLRINGDSTAGLHEAGMVSINPETDAYVDKLHTAGATTAWLANWGTVSGNTCELTVHAYNASGAPSWRSEGVRHSSSGAGNLRSLGWGHCTSDRTVSSLNIRPFSSVGNLFATCLWRLEGRLT